MFALHQLFLLNNVPSSKPHAMRHLVIVAMSNPFDDSPGTSDNGTADGADAKVTWESVAEKLQKVSCFSPEVTFLSSNDIFQSETHCCIV